MSYWICSPARCRYIMTNNRQKGKRGERYFANLLKPIFPEVRRNAGTQSQSGGVDLEHTDPFNIEVKFGKHGNIVKVLKWLEQVKSEGRKDNFDVVLVKPDRCDPYIIMPYDDFMEILAILKREEVI